MKLIWMQPNFPAAVLKYTKFPGANAVAVVVAPVARFERPAVLSQPPEVNALKAGEVDFLNTVAFLVQVVRTCGANLLAPKA